MDENTKKLIEKAQVKDTLEQEYKLTLEERINRHLELKPHGIVAGSHFAPVSAECHLLYRDGHFYGTISLAQAVAEALAKFLYNKNGWKPKKDFENNIQQLEKRGKITNELSTLFTKVWKNRDDYHHLNPQIEQDRQKLWVLAKNKLTDLRKIEQEIFAYTINNGKLVPRYPKYWDLKNGTVPVYLRFD